METFDKQLQETLSKKFEGAEMDVDPHVWEGIHASLQTPTTPDLGTSIGGNTAVVSSWMTWIVASVLLVGTLVWIFLPEEGSTRSKAPLPAQKEVLDTIQKTESLPIPQHQEFIDPSRSEVSTITDDTPPMQKGANTSGG